MSHENGGMKSIRVTMTTEEAYFIQGVLESRINWYDDPSEVAILEKFINLLDRKMEAASLG